MAQHVLKRRATGERWCAGAGQPFGGRSEDVARVPIDLTEESEPIDLLVDNRCVNAASDMCQSTPRWRRRGHASRLLACATEAAARGGLRGQVESILLVFGDGGQRLVHVSVRLGIALDRATRA
jgi:hypothetical protein